MSLPNTLTISRIILLPVFVLLFYLPVAWHYQAAFLVFVLAAVTDCLDGYMARRLGQTSALGAFLDPVADKLMVAVALILLVQDQPSIWLTLPAAVIIGREITVSALREWMAEVGASDKVAVSGYGKLKTICQMVALSLLIFNEPLFGIPIYRIGIILLYVAALLTLWSMVLYLIAARYQLTEGARD